MRHEYVNLNPETIRAEKVKARQVEMQYIDEQSEKQKIKYRYNVDETTPKKAFSEAVYAGGKVGLVIGSCLCIGTGAMVDVDTGTIPLTCFFVSPIIAIPIAYKIIQIKIHINKRKKQRLDNGMRNVEIQHDEAIRKINAEIDRECREFNEGFEEEVRNKIAEFSQPPIDQLYIRKFTNEFLDEISSQDRSAGARKIEAALTIKTYADKVLTLSNEYPLMNILFKPLEGFAEEMAMSRSVASAVQVELMTLLPEDPSGSQYFIEMQEGYELDAAVIRMVYKADNKGFKEIRSW